MRQLKRRILKNHGIDLIPTGISMEIMLAQITGRFRVPKLRSSLPKKKQREFGMRPSVSAELWQKEQERERLKAKCKLQNIKPA